ncbi:MAG: hypothetical protein IPK63_11730 [Candidatus Competibacteraceae bacterium]|nr:hypothetical protein [Candidatus Competibacteraceae bacterium]
MSIFKNLGFISNLWNDTNDSIVSYRRTKMLNRHPKRYLYSQSSGCYDKSLSALIVSTLRFDAAQFLPWFGGGCSESGEEIREGLRLMR